MLMGMDIFKMKIVMMEILKSTSMQRKSVMAMIMIVMAISIMMMTLWISRRKQHFLWTTMAIYLVMMMSAYCISERICWRSTSIGTCLPSRLNVQ